MDAKFKFNKEQFFIALKGFAMGVADIVPGVSGGTIAFITGIYDQLLKSISSVNMQFVRYILKLQIKNALSHIQFYFLFPLFCGIGFAILSTSRLMHYLLYHHPTYTWATFFGLIASSIYFVGKQIKQPAKPTNIMFLLLGTIMGYLLVSLIPVHTPNDYLYIFGSGMIAICAMILPGISGSFILLILGKYAFVTGALKNPFAANHLFVILVFCCGCLVGILSFSKFLNWFLKHYHNIAMAFLTGFMIGSMKKIWPWKETLESKVIRGKTYILREANILPDNFDTSVMIALSLMLLGFLSVIMIEIVSQQKHRGVSSTG
jgi:putative membrane protein